MKKMKIFLILILICVFGVTGCEKKNTSENKINESTTTSTTTESIKGLTTSTTTKKTKEEKTTTINKSTKKITTTKKTTKKATKKQSTTKVTTTTEKKLSGTVTKTPDYKVVKYSINFDKHVTPSLNTTFLNGYNNEFLIKFEKPIVVDDYGYAAFMNYESINNNISKLLREKSTEKAKQMFGEDKDYCVQYDEYQFARNKDNDIVGVVARAVIGTRAYTGWCDDNVTTVFLDNRIVLYQDDASNTFKNR